ncbi:autophagy protein Apg5-domain-containing protein [Obelidium mucronatum]|nr:autophagy protein Apg5-domain-containing protein [Obelidium mucronatum]
MEREATTRIWLGAVPIVVSLAAADNTLPPRDPLHLLALRCAYLPLYAAALKAHFFATPPLDEAAELWFSCEGIPLKWHYPIGLLHDIVTYTPFQPPAAQTPQTPQLPTQITPLPPTHHHFATIPWRITLHVSNFPSDKIFKAIPTASLQNNPPRDFYMNSLKESEFIRHTSIKKVMSLPKSDQMLLWNSLVESVEETAEWGSLEYKSKLTQLHDAFWAVNSKLLGPPSSSSSSSSNVAGVESEALSPSGGSGAGAGRSVAVRLYLGYDKPVCQDLVHPDTTLLHALHVLVPSIVPVSSAIPQTQEQQQQQQQHEHVSPDSDPLSTTTHVNEPSLNENPPNSTTTTKKFRVITHGVEVPLDTSLLWLSRNFSYPDNFLHLVLEGM